MIGGGLSRLFPFFIRPLSFCLFFSFTNERKREANGERGDESDRACDANCPISLFLPVILCAKGLHSTFYVPCWLLQMLSFSTIAHCHQINMLFLTDVVVSVLSLMMQSVHLVARNVLAK